MQDVLNINKVSLMVSGRRITNFTEDSAVPKLSWNDPDVYKIYPGIMGTRPQVVKAAFRIATIEFDLFGDGDDYKFLKALQLTNQRQVVTYVMITGETITSVDAVLRQVGENKEDTANGIVGRHIVIDLCDAIETTLV